MTKPELFKRTVNFRVSLWELLWLCAGFLIATNPLGALVSVLIIWFLGKEGLRERILERDELGITLYKDTPIVPKPAKADEKEVRAYVGKGGKP